MRRRWVCSAFIVLVVFLPALPARPQSAASAANRPYVVQGSTTFAHRVMEPYQHVIEAASGHKLTVVPNKSSRGLLSLFERVGDFGMISGPLNSEIRDLRSTPLALPFDRLQTFDIARTRMAFAINRANPVRTVTDHNMRRILLGEVTNWREVGGPDLPIMVVMVKAGGGVGASIESEFLGGRSIKPANPLIVQGSSQVIKITEMLPGGLGLSQLGLVRKSALAELKTEHPIEQHLALVTLGEPTPEMKKVIEAARSVMSKSEE
jgi:phosphate transport system substrate-binding protein